MHGWMTRAWLIWLKLTTASDWAMENSNPILNTDMFCIKAVKLLHLLLIIFLTDMLSRFDYRSSSLH